MFRRRWDVCTQRKTRVSSRAGVICDFGLEVEVGVVGGAGYGHLQKRIIFRQHIANMHETNTQAQHTICYINHSRRQTGEEKVFDVWVVECMCLDGRGEVSD